MLGNPLNLPDDECPTDDKFFEYFRSLAFAHPFKTDRPKFFQKDEIQYSPWVIANSSITNMRGGGVDAVGVRIYSNKLNEIKDLIIKHFIRSRYLLLEKATTKVNQIILNKNSEWKKRKICRFRSPLNTLKEINNILVSRYEVNSYIEAAITYMECVSTLPENDSAIEKFRNAICSEIPFLCDAVDELDYSKIANRLSSIVYTRPKNMYQMAHYQLEKIYSYLNENQSSDNRLWALKQAEDFWKALACKWVMINLNEMSLEEIKLLVAVACYLEVNNQ